MAKTIAIKVKVDGQERAVKNIGELEKAVSDLREELKGVDIGSEDFAKLSGQIQNAESKLKTLNKSFEGLEPQQRAEAFVKFGEGIAGSFAIATAALTSFGVESEEVQKAQLAVTQALTAAVGLRQIAEAGLQARIVATTISQYAYNAAATAGNAVTKAFYTTLAANPIGAIVVAVAALAAGIYALVSAQEEEIDVQKEINKTSTEALKSSVEYRLEIEELGRIINDNNANLEDRELALKQLKTILPELEGLELDNKEALDKVNKAIERNIQLSLAQAKTEGIKQFIIKKTQELLELQNGELEDNVGFWEKVGNFITSAGNIGIYNLKNIETSVKNYGETATQITESITEAQEAYSDALRKELQIQQDVDAGRQGAVNRLKEQEGETKKAEDALRALIQAREENVRRLVAQIQELGRALSFNYGEPKVLGDLREITAGIKSLQDALEPQSFQEAVNDFFGVNLPKPADVFGTFYDEARELIGLALFGKTESVEFKKSAADIVKQINSEFEKVGSAERIKFSDLIGAKSIEEVTTQLSSALAKLTQEEVIPIDTFVAFQTLSSEYGKLNELITQTPDITKVLGDTKYYSNLKNFLISTGQIVFDEVNGQIQLLDISKVKTEDLVNAVGNLGEAEAKVYADIVKSLTDTGQYSEEQVQRLALQRVQSLREISVAIVTQEEQIRGVLFEAQQLEAEIITARGEGLNTQNELFRQFILQNTSLLVDSYADVLETDEEYKRRVRINAQERADIENQVANSFAFSTEKQQRTITKFFVDRKILAQDIAAFETTLAQQGIYLADFTTEEQLKIWEEYYQKRQEQREKDGRDQKDESEGFWKELAKNLNEVARTAQLGVQVFQQYTATQLQIMNETEERLLDQIVGDSEEAAEKRLEIQEDYEKRRKELSKKGQLAQLQLTRIQAVANVAESITAAQTAGPGIGQVLAILAASLGAIQVGIITGQITQLQNLRRGGFLSGPSHEQGGIPLGQTGVFAEGGEVVINRQSAIDYRGLLNNISQSGGGRPIVSSPYDDSRLIEAITKQNREPIKAYVLEQDVTQAQAVNKRLQQLSKI